MSYPRSISSTYEACRHGRSHLENLAHNAPSSYFALSPLSIEQQHRLAYDNASSSEHALSFPFDGSESHSRRYPNQMSPFPRLLSQSSRTDENMNPSYDESYQMAPLSEGKCSQICADFVNANFKCPVCLDVLLEATVVSCGHQFCRACIETWLKRKPVCPVCGKEVTEYFKEYSVDSAINSVEKHLSDEWKTRRMITSVSRQVQANKGSSFVVCTNYYLSTLTQEAKRISKRGWKFLKNAFQKIVVSFLIASNWVEENISIQDFSKGVVVGLMLVILFYISDQIVTFIQYMYYAISAYQRNVPIEQQIAAIKGGKAFFKKSNPSKYKDFVGLPDTIFAKFISSFYEPNQFK